MGSASRPSFAGNQGKATADQISTVSKLRLLAYAGALDAAQMQQVQQAIKTQPGLR